MRLISAYLYLEVPIFDTECQFADVSVPVPTDGVKLYTLQPLTYDNIVANI